MADFLPRVWTLIPALLLVAVATGTASAEGPTTVDIEGHQFKPAESTVQVGGVITWANRDVAPHNAVAFDGTFRTERLAQGQSDSITFLTVGQFPYQCKIHPSMRGQVVVTAATALPPATDSSPGLTKESPTGVSPEMLIGLIAMAALAAALGWLRARIRRTRSSD